MDHPYCILFQQNKENEQRRLRLEAKFVEYRDRQATEFAVTPSDRDVFWNLNNLGKIIILERVLGGGRVIQAELFRELFLDPATERIVRCVDWQYGNPFHTVFDVIFDYVANREVNASGGTGLP